MTSFSLVDCVNTILREIAIPRSKRRDIAQTYRLILESDEENIDWARINKAIVARWSMAGLIWIKKQAWSERCFAEKK